MENSKEILSAASNAAAMLDAVYQWVDRIEKAGGTTGIEGISVCHAFVSSLQKNRHRTEQLVIAPLQRAIKASQ